MSYERHIKILQAEFSKTKRNPQVVAELMAKTFFQWRVELLSEPYALPYIFERFPFLHEVEHVSAIFSWLRLSLLFMIFCTQLTIG